MSAVTELAADMARAAADFLAALSPAQREQANLPFDDEDERRRWYYFPRQRAGLPFAAMTSRAQQQSALRLLASGLSEAGYNAATMIIGLDNVLDGRGGVARQQSPVCHPWSPPCRLPSRLPAFFGAPAAD